MRRIFMAIGALSLVMLTACGGGSSLPTSSAGSATTAARTTAVNLASLLPEDVGTGAILQPDSVGDTGLSNLAKAIRDDGAPDARAVLVSAGFKRGYQRMWAGPARLNQSILFLYEFQSPRGASTYGKHAWAVTVAGQRSKGATSQYIFSVSSIPSAMGLRVTYRQISGAAVDFVKGPYLGQAIALGPHGTDQTERAIRLAELLYRRLP